MSSFYYKGSNRYAPGRLFTGLVLGSIVVLAMSVLYGVIMWQMQVLYVSVGLVPVFAFGVTEIARRLLRFAKVRNEALAVALGLYFGLLSVYAAWVGWVFAFSGLEFVVLQPGDLLHVVQQAALQGVWAIGDFTPTGFLLYFCWVVEALSILALVILLAPPAVRGVAFCESCDDWIDHRRIIGAFHLGDTSGMRRELESGGKSFVSKLEPVALTDAAYTVVVLEKCSHCTDSHFLTVKDIETKETPDGPKVSESVIVERLRVKPELAQEVETLWNKWEAGNISQNESVSELKAD